MASSLSRISYTKTAKAFLRLHRSLQTMSLAADPRFQSVRRRGDVQLLNELFSTRGWEIRLAGGPVRDILRGLVPNDLDFATTATPTQMKELFQEKEIRVINELGEKHGTITARINEENYEITTLRIDKVTDGRRAEIEFTLDWKLDANRRDLTINSMFLDMEGTLYDYFGGREDLEKCRIAFVGKPERRIKEDYLRILRYFRFYGRIAKLPDAHDEAMISAIKANVAGMKQISGERIWTEWSKILKGNFSGVLTLKMLDVGLAPYIGLPENPDRSNFYSLYQYNETLPVKDRLEPMTLLSQLLDNCEQMMVLHERLKLSGYERDLGLFLIRNRSLKPSSEGDRLKVFKDIIIDERSKRKVIIQYIVQLLRIQKEEALISELLSWDIPKFPVTGHDLLEAGCSKGRILGVVLNEMLQIWKQSDFTLSKDELMQKMDVVVERLEANNVNKKRKTTN